MATLLFDRFAAYHDHADIISILLAAGASIDIAGDDGWTVLHYACFYSATESAVLLVAAGANPHQPDSDGDTPLSIARGDTLAALRDMLPSRATALALLEDIVDTTSLNADLADVVLYHRCVFNSSHCGLAEEYRAARRAERERQRLLEEVKKEQEGEAEDEKEGEEEEEEGEGEEEEEEEGDDDTVEGSGMDCGARTAKRRRCE